MITLEFLLPIGAYAVAAAFTPGPNNIMMTASGANFGYWRSMRHILGITFGFPVMFMAVALGFSSLFERFPQLHLMMRFAGAAFLLYLAWKIATATRAGRIRSRARPLGFFAAAAFQWVNPKAWVFVVTTIATFTSPGANLFSQATVMAALFTIITFAAVSTWCLFGTAIGRLLSTDRALRLFNMSMAGLLAASVLFILL